MNIIRARGIPIWVTLIALLVGTMGTIIGIGAMMNPSSISGFVEGAERLGITYGGRNTGLGVALLLAVLLRNAAGYAVAFFASVFRELSDIIVTFPDSTGTAIGLGVFLLIEIICLIISLRAAIGNNSTVPMPSSN